MTSLKNILIPFAFFIFTIFVVEYISSYFLQKNKQETYPLVYNYDKQQISFNAMQQSWGEKLEISYLDPLLGYARKKNVDDVKLPNYEIIGHGNIKILILGGSTTSSHTAVHLDPNIHSIDESYSWPRELVNIIGVNKATIYNGAVAGYYSSSELLKLIRDIHFIEPDIVISLSGVNELDGHAHKGYQLLSKYQKNIFTKMARVNDVNFMPNTISIFRYIQNIRLVEGVDFGPYHGVNSFDRWANNISMIEAISRSVNSRYYVFLQPVIGVQDDKSKYFKNKKINDKYLANLRKFYTRAEKHCASVEFCFSLTQVFPDDEEYYIDPRHQTRAGVKLISENIYNHLFGK